MKPLSIIAGLLVATLVSGCLPGPKSSEGFRLPDGDAKKGEQAFLDLKCNRCHTVEGVELPPPRVFNLTLGGETTRVKTYGELVTSIINPSHVLSQQYKKQMVDAKESPMLDLTKDMSVRQVIDLVAFLQPHYRLVETSKYRTYP